MAIKSGAKSAHAAPQPSTPSSAPLAATGASPIMNRMRTPPASQRPVPPVPKQSEREQTRFRLQEDELGKLIDKHVKLLHSIGWPKLL